MKRGDLQKEIVQAPMVSGSLHISDRFLIAGVITAANLTSLRNLVVSGLSSEM
jgi:hypothetical protein